MYPEFWSVHLPNFLIQSLLAIWFLRTIETTGIVGPRRRILSYASFLLMLPLFMSTQFNLSYNIWSTTIRFFYRALIYVIYLRLRKNTPYGAAVYVSLLLACIYTVCQSFLQTPLLFDAMPAFWVNLMRDIIYVPFFAVSAYLLPLERIYHITRERAVTMGLVVLCLLYTKNSLFTFNYTGMVSPSALSVYLILLHLFLFAFLIFFERYVSNTHQLEQIRMQEIVNGYRFRNMKAHQASEADLRALHHDMKNHLLGIQEVARKNGDEQVVEYTRSLMSRFSDYERRVQTGNELLDGLLNEKAREAEAEQISVTIAIDFRLASYVDDVDLCTIFGNAVDNAIEACKKVYPPQNRFLNIKSSQAAGSLFVSIQNCYAEQLHFQNNIPLTTKAQPFMHGFGLPNIQSAMGKYCGLLSIDTSRDQCFTLTLIFPLSDAEK